GEKAGIIKRGVPVVSAPQRPEARTVFARRASECGARLVETSDVWRPDKVTSCDGFYGAIASRRPDGSEIVIAPSLPGQFQIQNALTAASTAVVLCDQGFKVPEDAVKAGISSARWPGRLERLSERPAIYLDGAHNPAAARELKTFWEDNFAGRRIHLIYGAMRDKAVDEVAGLLFPMAEDVILTRPRQLRAISAQHLDDIVGGLARRAEVVGDPAQAFERAIAQAVADDVIFVTGSLFLVGDIRRYWFKRNEQTSSSAR
ncbi:MAG TPA: cyanophycin synthetase, partial [Candidatus Acidoferrales bacterium]|nr:cyanophycin synthetase [Candidatus Acidoferrales bacterium]